MHTEGLIFTNYKFRCHSLGNIMTNLESITQGQLAELEKLEVRLKDSETNPKMKLTEIMEKRLAELREKRDKEDDLPTGAKSFLDGIFNEVFWGRKEMLQLKAFERGLLVEEDVLDLHSKIDGEFYVKNDEHRENEYIQGTCDNIYGNIVRDAKASQTLKSFQDVDSLSTTYNFQGKGYCILWDVEEFEICYGLVNAPLHHLQNELTRLYYQFGNPADDNPEYVAARQLCERNHIYDIDKWKQDYPNYQFENTALDFSIPAKLRAKKFHGSLKEEDKENIARRVLLARLYLCEKEIEAKKAMGIINE